MVKNPDGTFTIKNQASGETKTVSATDLPQYGLSPNGPTSQPDYAGSLNAKVTAPIVGLQGQQLGNTGQAIQNQKSAGTVLPDIQSAQSSAVISGQEAAKQQAFNNIQQAFDKVKGKDGKVAPWDYNAAKDAASKYMTADEFDQRFQDNYTNPNNVYYNTPDDIAVRKTLPQVANIVKSYYGLDKGGPNWDQLTKIPGLGDYFKKTQMGNEIAHDQQLTGTSAEILKLAGAGTGSTVRGTTAELANVVNLLPRSSDSKDTAQNKLDKLDTFMQKTYGTSLKDWLGQ